MEIKIVKNSINKKELIDMAKAGFGDLVKAVVDIDQGIMAVGGEMHADEEVILIEQQDSEREHTWGINIYPEESKEKFIEFDSMVNIKPSYNNRSRNVKNSDTRKKIKTIVEKLIVE